METTSEVKKQFVKLGFNKEETQEVVGTLNLLVSNYHVFYQKLRNYHWNVKGPDFFDLHEKFEELYLAAVINIDEIAERIRVYGHTPFSTFREYLDNSEITETGTNLTSKQMVAEVLTDIEIIDSFLVDAIDIASEIGDVATVEIANRMIRDIEKQHWMLTAFTGR
jgi:starvation-inducible DNA-binding protein